MGNPQEKRNTQRPRMSWQVDEFAHRQTLTYTVPYTLLLLCKVLDVTPRQVLFDFMDDLSQGSWKREGRTKTKEKLLEYILLHGYGQQHYTQEEITDMFADLDALGRLFPKGGPNDVAEAYLAFREAHHQYWFDKRFNKNNRSPMPNG